VTGALPFATASARSTPSTERHYRCVRARATIDDDANRARRRATIDGHRRRRRRRRTDVTAPRARAY